MIKKWVNKYLHWLRSDIQLVEDKCWEDGGYRVDGYQLYSKPHNSNRYQYHAVVGIETIQPVLNNIKAAKKVKKGVEITIVSGNWKESIYINKRSVAKAEELLEKLLRDVYTQEEIKDK